MTTINVIIESSKDAYSAYASNVEGLSGMGDTVQEAQASFMESIEIVKTFPADQVPAALKGEYQIEWEYDTASLLMRYRSVINHGALAKAAGINEKQLSHYAAGLKRPRLEQRKKIEAALHKLGSELMAVRL